MVPTNTQSSSNTTPVDLVLIIDTSSSMEQVAQDISNAADAAVEKAKTSCPSNLQVKWFGIEGIWEGTKFNQTLRDYLVNIGITESDIRGRKKGTVASWGAQEDGARAVEDISNNYNWRSGASRAIFYISDEALEGGGQTTDQEDVDAANRAIQAAQNADVIVHTYYTGNDDKTRDEFARVAQETGGEAFTTENLSGENASETFDSFTDLLKTAICASKPPEPPAPPPEEKVFIVGAERSRFRKDYMLYALDLQTGNATKPLRLGQGVYDIAFWGNELYWVIEAKGYQLLKADLDELRTKENYQVIGRMKRPIKGLTFNPTDGQLYGIGEGRLFEINTKTAEAKPLGSLGRGGSLDDCDLAINSKGEAYTGLYNRSFSATDILAKVDLKTGKPEKIGEIQFKNVVGMGFVDDVLYGITHQDELITINLSDGHGKLLHYLDPIKKDGWSGMAVRSAS